MLKLKLALITQVIKNCVNCLSHVFIKLFSSKIDIPSIKLIWWSKNTEKLQGAGDLCVTVRVPGCQIYTGQLTIICTSEIIQPDIYHCFYDLNCSLHLNFQKMNRYVNDEIEIKILIGFLFLSLIFLKWFELFFLIFLKSSFCFESHYNSSN